MKNIQTMVIVGILILGSLMPIIKADGVIQKENGLSSMVNYEYTSENELLVTFHLPEFSETQINTEQGAFIQLEIPNAGFIGTIGTPQLPAVSKLIAVSTDHCSWEVTQAQIREIRPTEKIYPVQNPQPDNGNDDPVFVYDPSAYQQNQQYPGRVAEITDHGNIRDIPFMKIQFCPLQYNPAQQRLTIYDTIVVKLLFTPTESLTVEPDYTQKDFYPYYSNVFDNWHGFLANTVIHQQTIDKNTGCDYLIITHENYYAQAVELAQWKQYTGYLVKVVNVTFIGTTYQQIRSFLIDAYTSWTPRPSYVVLIGDAEWVPTTYYNGVATDLWYAAVDGQDYYPDLFIGRIPADTAQQAEVMIQKTITYEHTPPMVPSFYNNFVVAAYFQDDNTNGYEDRRFVLTSEEVRDYLLTQGYEGQRIYVTDSYVTPTHYNNDYYADGEPLPAELLRPTFAWDGDAQDICTAIQQGIFLLNHRDHGMESGWGDPYFTSDDFDSFSNGDLLPVVFSINCLTGKFDTGECFCEEFLRKNDGGAVAVFGATEVSYSGYNDYFCRGLYDGMWPEFDTTVGDDIPLYHLGEILNYGKVFMAQTWGDPWGYEEYQFELFHCFGDPSLDMYTALPGSLEVTYTFLSESIQITVKGAGVPVQGARVCLSQESGFYATGITNETGCVQFDKTGVSVSEPVLLVANAHNYLCYSASFMLNQKPQTPNTPTGSTEGKPNTEYMYHTSTIDADGDMVYYNFSWGDGTYSGWVGPFSSGADAFERHAWSQQGSYNITVKAKDTKGDESDWSEPLPITMPLSIPFSHPILQWLYNLIMARFPFVGSLLLIIAPNNS
jgi:hypothetical protein